MWNIKSGQLVEIDWLDPSVGSQWEDASKITACAQFVVKSIGWVHVVDDFGCVLTASYEPDGDKQLLLRQHLPWGCIQEIWILGD